MLPYQISLNDIDVFTNFKNHGNFFTNLELKFTQKTIYESLVFETGASKIKKCETIKLISSVVKALNNQKSDSFFLVKRDLKKIG